SLGWNLAEFGHPHVQQQSTTGSCPCRPSARPLACPNRGVAGVPFHVRRLPLAPLPFDHVRLARYQSLRRISSNPAEHRQAPPRSPQYRYQARRVESHLSLESPQN
ncbi:unnamed protein product, partial [Ectocarpus sp. 13 AM-2016]